MVDADHSEHLVATSRAVPTDKIDQRVFNQFSERSLSENTRRAYKRVVREFFRFVNHRHPSTIESDDVRRWRDQLIARKQKPSTVAFKLTVIRSLYGYLKLEGLVWKNPALTKLVPTPQVSEEIQGRVLAPKEVRNVLAGPDQSSPAGSRDYAILLLLFRSSLRVAEVCSLRLSSIRWSHGRWVLRVKVKGGRERSIPLPADVKKAIDHYMKLDKSRRYKLDSDEPTSFLFQPISNYRTLVFDKGLSTVMVWNIVRRWAAYAGLGKLSPHDARRTAITRALDQGLSYRQVQMMSGHRDPKTVMRYDHHRENMDQNAVNFLSYSEPESDT